MKRQNIALLTVFVVIAVGLTAVSTGMNTEQASNVSPEPPSTTLGSHGDVMTLQSAKIEKGFVSYAREELPGLRLSSVRTSEHATYVYYSPTGLSINADTTLTDFVKNGGIMIETYDQPEERKLAQLEQVKNANLKHVRFFEIQGQPAFGYPMDGITPTLLKIFPQGTDKRITLASGGTVDELVEIAQKINLS